MKPSAPVTSTFFIGVKRPSSAGRSCAARPAAPATRCLAIAVRRNRSRPAPRRGDGTGDERAEIGRRRHRRNRIAGSRNRAEREHAAWRLRAGDRNRGAAQSDGFNQSVRRVANDEIVVEHHAIRVFVGPGDAAKRRIFDSPTRRNRRGLIALRRVHLDRQRASRKFAGFDARQVAPPERDRLESRHRLGQEHQPWLRPLRSAALGVRRSRSIAADPIARTSSARQNPFFSAPARNRSPNTNNRSATGMRPRFDASAPGHPYSGQRGPKRPC